MRIPAFLSTLSNSSFPFVLSLLQLPLSYHWALQLLDFFSTIINSTSTNIFMHKTLSAFFYLYYFPSAESLKQKCLVKAVCLLPDCFQCDCTNQTASLLVDFLCFCSWPLVCRLDLPFLPWERTDICTAQSWVELVSLPVWHSVGSERKFPAPPVMCFVYLTGTAASFLLLSLHVDEDHLLRH